MYFGVVSLRLGVVEVAGLFVPVGEDETARGVFGLFERGL